jgi:hypothetical protein
MVTARQLISFIATTLLAVAGCMAQNIAPSHSGTVHYFEGDVSIDGTKLVSQTGRFSDLKEQSTLQTAQGRAEILLTPGVLLRLGENTSIKMLDSRLMSTRVELLSGTAMMEDVESGETVKDPPVTLVYKDFSAQPAKFGLFEMNSDPGQVKVFKGEARVTGNGSTETVKDGNLINLGTTMASAKFDAKDGDDLYLWSRDRSAYLSAGNMASARTMASSGYGYGNSYGGVGYAGWDPSLWRGFSGGWYYNSYMGMYSYIPFGGTMYDPFGYGYYNPITIGYVYMPGYYWNGAGGTRTGATTGVPLLNGPTVRSGSTTGVSQLPRLGVTATLRPTPSAPARGIQPTTTLASRNLGTPSSNSTTASSSGGVTGSVRSAAPVASAAPAGGGMRGAVATAHR